MSVIVEKYRFLKLTGNATTWADQMAVTQPGWAWSVIIYAQNAWWAVFKQETVAPDSPAS